jgi:hypothetical protein
MTGILGAEENGRRTMNPTLPDHTNVIADLRLLFGPEIEDIEIERALHRAMDDLRSTYPPSELLDHAKRLAEIQLDAQTSTADDQ